MSDESVSKNGQNNESEAEENNQQPIRSLGLDLGDDCVYSVDANRLGSQPQPGTSGMTESTTSNPRREDNPFSFKHFLRDTSNSHKNYQSVGARPKVYTRENRHSHVSPPESPHRTTQTSRLVNEFSSALPDFVQDHLVVEQCFLASKPSSSQAYDLDLPDFTQADQRPMNGPTVSRSSSMDEPSGGPIPLDLPGLSLGNAFPLDLPLSMNAPLSEAVRTTPLAEVGNSKSLPDFLTDGPVRSSGDGGLPMSSPVPSTSTGGDLRNDMRCHRCAELRIELASARQRASRAEDEADKNSRKSTVAENTVLKLKQELKALKTQFRHLQLENQALKASIGAASLEGGFYEMPPPRLAQELRAAASTAEHSLRSLLTGVDNLRMMASALESMSRIEEKPDRFSNFDDSSGPAL